MRYLICIIVFLFPVQLYSQSTIISEPQHIVVDSRDNIFVTRKYGLVKIAPDGTITDLSKQGSGKGMDRAWSDLIIDSKDNLYAHDGNVIYKIVVSSDNKVTLTKFAGQEYSYKLEDGPLATAGFNAIGLMTIDRQDNIYLTDSYDKIKDTIGTNFVTDDFPLSEQAKKHFRKNRRGYNVIRKIDTRGVVSTLKTPDGKYILPNQVSGMTIDLQGNIIFGSYSFGRFIGKIDIATGAITLVAGQPYKREWCPVYSQGPIAIAEFVEPETLIVNKKGEILFTDQRINRVIKIADGKVSTLAGGNIIDPCSQNIAGRSQEGNKDGRALSALFNFPKGMAYDSKGNLYIADMYNHSVRRLSPDGTVSTFAK
ncbi:MAG TPA: hypothetical protein VJV05_04060 [Pyrinomonadaceae bacterium]|nr:hypothetical protein [Pyrinomonadaceae bacterium]